LNTTDDRSGLQITLPARAENVTVVRHALAGLADRLGMDDAGIADLKTVVTEACMNVVVHAYPDGHPGPLEVIAVPDEGGITVGIRDYGLGIQPRPDIDRPSLRIGLTLIAALSSSFEIKGGIGRGTEIRMHLALKPSEDAGDGVSPAPAVGAAPEATELEVKSPEFVGPVLGRALSALAARREIGIDRISDAVLLSDAISANAPQAFTDGHVRLAITDRDEGLELRVGPMKSGGAEQLRDSFELPEVGGSLESLADELRVEKGDDGDYLVIAIAAIAD
jgi:anti-sigma regulatory factor (Ser/Thr protein kinase)